MISGLIQIVNVALFLWRIRWLPPILEFLKPVSDRVLALAPDKP